MKHHRKLYVSFDPVEEKFIENLIKYSATKFVSNDTIKEWIAEYRENHDEDVLNKILAQVTRFIVFIARKHKTHDLDIQDLIIEAIYGVIEAIDKHYDLTSDKKFITYIKIIIERRIRDVVTMYKNAVVLPKNIQSQQAKLRKVGDKRNIIYSKINFYHASEVRGLYNALSSDYVSVFVRQSLYTDINRVLNALLTPEERYVIISLYGLNDSPIRPVALIGADLQLSSAEVNNLIASAIEKLKTDDNCINLLRGYLEDFN